MSRLVAWLARNPLIIALASVLIVFALWWSSCRPTPTPIPPRENKTLDSLDATKPAFTAHRDTLIRAETVYIAKSAINRAGAIKSTRAADSLHALAIAAQRLAEAERDTSSHWRDVAILRGIETDSLRSANGGLLAALEEQTMARTAADARDADAERRLTATTDLNSRLANDLRRADPPCRVLPFVKCPSRKIVAVTSLALGIVAKIEYDKRKP